MIKYFRRIRQKLLANGRLSKYLVYAIGEIALVMIGILLALQVSNWNEHRKDRVKETTYLNDIKDDLQSNVVELNHIIETNHLRLSLYKLIDPDFYIRDDMKVTIDEPDLITRKFFDRGRSYRPTIGSYSSLISEGQSKLIQNRMVFNQLQEIYEVEYAHIASIYETLKVVEIDLKKKRVFDIKYSGQKNINEISDKSMLADLSLLHDLRRHYTSTLMNQRERIKEAIELLDNELIR